MKLCTMKFEDLVKGHLVKRYKRFLADVRLANGEIVTAHCTNSGSMLSCLEEGAEVAMSKSDNPKRKTPFTWEMIKMDKTWVGVNTSNPNKLAQKWIEENRIPGLDGYTEVKREVVFGDSRIDILASNEKEKCFIEVKNVTYRHENWALFPDAVTSRGLKHLNTLVQAKEKGYRAVMLYIIQRDDVEVFGTASHIDPKYAETLDWAMGKGLEVFPVRAIVTPDEIKFDKLLEYAKFEV